MSPNGGVGPFRELSRYNMPRRPWKNPLHRHARRPARDMFGTRDVFGRPVVFKRAAGIEILDLDRCRVAVDCLRVGSFFEPCNQVGIDGFRPIIVKGSPPAHESPDNGHRDVMRTSTDPSNIPRALV